MSLFLMCKIWVDGKTDTKWIIMQLYTKAMLIIQGLQNLRNIWMSWILCDKMLSIKKDSMIVDSSGLKKKCYTKEQLI